MSGPESDDGTKKCPHEMKYLNGPKKGEVVDVAIFSNGQCKEAETCQRKVCEHKKK